MSILLQSKDQWQKLLDRAIAAGGAKPVTKTGEGRYSVLSSNGRDFYRVTIHGDHWLCDCPAGSHGTACKHLGMVYVHTLGEQMRAAVAPAGTAARVVSTAARDSIWGQGSTL